MGRRIATLRGSLPAEEPGSRGLERFARNPECGLLRAITLTGLTPAAVSETVYEVAVHEGQSPFAIQTGNNFESRLIENDGEQIFGLYQAAGRLSPAEHRMVDLADRFPIYPNMSLTEKKRRLAAREAESLRLIRMKLDGDPTAPNLIIKPRLIVSLLGVAHGVEPDALVAPDGPDFYRPVEIKSYPDRRGKTDASDLRNACRQAAIGVIALRETLRGLGAPDAEQLAQAMGDLILRMPGRFAGALHAMPLKREVLSIDYVLNEAPRMFEMLDASLPPDASLDQLAVVNSIPIHYRASCKEHCALALICKKRACQAGDPRILGDDASEKLVAAGTTDRALELLNGTGAPPQTPAEQQLAEDLQRMWAAYQQEVPHVV